MDGAHHTTQVGTTDYYRLDQTSVLTSICCTGGDYFDNVERSIEIPDDTLLARDTAPPNILVTLVLYNGTEVESKTVSLDGVGVVFDYPAAISKIKVSNYQFDHFCQVNGTDTAHPTSQTDKDVYRLDYPCVVKYISCKSGGEYHSSSSTTTYLPTPTYKPVPTYTPDSKATPDTGKTIVHVTFITETHETRAIHVYANGQEETLVLPGKILSIIVPDYEFGKFCQLKGPEGVLVTVKERSHIGTYNFHHPTVVTSIRCHSGGEVTHPVEHVEFVDTNGTVTKVTIPRDNKYRHNTIAKGKIARITAEDPTSLRRCCFLVGRYEGLIGPQFAPLDLEHIGKGPQEIESYKCAEKNLYHLFERDSLCFGSGEMEWAN
ncbi:hypothetical protein B0J14DRAFT_604528 [Halenospora varia]|nr:hypothetical protein B0J14DRAFT_604528 [Halenospora varia]